MNRSRHRSQGSKVFFEENIPNSHPSISSLGGSTVVDNNEIFGGLESFKHHIESILPPATVHHQTFSKVPDISFQTLLQHSQMLKRTNDLLNLQQQGLLNDAIVHSTQVYDDKISLLEQRKSVIIELIEKFNKERIDIELEVISLQNRKYQMLSNAVSRSNQISMPKSDGAVTGASTGISSKRSPLKMENLVKTRSTTHEPVTSTAGTVAAASSISKEKSQARELSSSEKAKGSEQKQKTQVGKRKREAEVILPEAAATPITNDDSADATPQKISSDKPRAATPSESSKKVLKLTVTESKHGKSPSPNDAKSINISTNSIEDNQSENQNSNTPPVHVASNEETEEPPQSPLTPPPLVTVDKTSARDDQINHQGRDKKKRSNRRSGVYPIGPIAALDPNVTITKLSVDHHNNDLIAASTNGEVIGLKASNLKESYRIKRHNNTITDMFIYGKPQCIYTISLDGYIKRTLLKDGKYELKSYKVDDELQLACVSWNTAFIASRTGKIYSYNLSTNKLNGAQPLSTFDKTISAVQTGFEGPRRVLFVATKENLVYIRCARSGLLLRTFTLEDRSSQIFSLIYDNGFLFCGTQRGAVYKLNVATGEKVLTLSVGNVAVLMKRYERKYLIVGCYDGLIYVFDEKTGKKLCEIVGAGKLIQSLTVFDGKIITSAKYQKVLVIDLDKNINKSEKN